MVLTDGANPVDYAEAPLSDLALNDIISDRCLVFVGATDRFHGYVTAVVVARRCELVVLSTLVLLTAVPPILIHIDSAGAVRLSIPISAIPGRTARKLFMRRRKGFGLALR